MTDRISGKRKSFDHRDSHSLDVTSGASCGSDEDVRLSLPEALEVQTSETVEPFDDPPDDHAIPHRAHFLLERRSSLPRTHEVMDIPRLESGEGESEDAIRSRSSSDGSVEDKCIRESDATGKRVYQDHPLQQSLLTHTDTSVAREAITSSVSSFATACFDVYQMDDDEIGGYLREENPPIVPFGSHVSVRICHSFIIVKGEKAVNSTDTYQPSS